MKISVIGAGYVGLTTAVCLADAGHQVICVDIDPEKVRTINKGVSPMFEEGLESKLKRVLKRENFECTTDYDRIKDTEITFITVGTPLKEDGGLDLKQIKAATRKLAQILKQKDGYHIVVIKSTVPPGITKDLVIPILEEYSGKKIPGNIGVCTSPEFLREGKAIHDFLNPGRVIIGGINEDRRAGDKLIELYENFPSRHVVIRTGLTEAEMIKLASNAFLATRVSFANEIGNICNALGIDGHIVMDALSLDTRFGRSHLRPGPAYGGPCLPKDMRGLITRSKQLSYKPTLLESVETVNIRQKENVVKLCEQILGSLRDKRISVLGLAFKENTDDIRESQAIDIVHRLLAKNARVVVYDPLATDDAKKMFGDKTEYAENPSEALRGGHCCIIVTEWGAFKNLEEEFEGMAQKNVIDIGGVIGKNRAKDLGLNYFNP